MKLLLLVHVASTLLMVGAIWIVQVVHYPLFSGVGADGWAAYEARHQTQITWVVGPLMVLELVTAVWLVVQRPEVLPAWLVIAGVVLVGVTWASTAFVQVPLHTVLGTGGFDADVHARLVATNWFRTVAWSARGALVLGMLWLVMRPDLLAP